MINLKVWPYIWGSVDVFSPRGGTSEPCRHQENRGASVKAVRSSQVLAPKGPPLNHTKCLISTRVAFCVLFFAIQRVGFLTATSKLPLRTRKTHIKNTWAFLTSCTASPSPVLLSTHPHLPLPYCSRGLKPPAARLPGRTSCHPPPHSGPVQGGV